MPQQINNPWWIAMIVAALVMLMLILTAHFSHAHDNPTERLPFPGWRDRALQQGLAINRSFLLEMRLVERNEMRVCSARSVLTPCAPGNARPPRTWAVSLTGDGSFFCLEITATPVW